MKLRAVSSTNLFVSVIFGGWLLGCSSSPSNDSNTAGTAGAPASGGVGGAPIVGGSPAVTAGTSGGGRGGSAGNPGTAGSSGSAGSGMATAGSGGSAPSGGAGGTGPSNTGGAGRPSGGAPSGGVGGSAGAGTTAGAGGGGNPNLKGGASGAFVCKAGATYGNPLEGMGSITTISAPTMGKVTYFAFIEGPVWIGSVGKLFFSDIVSPERIWTITPPSTTPELYMEGAGNNGLAVDSNDKLLAADQVMKRIVRIDPTSGSPAAQMVASTGMAKPNDLVMRSDGNIYFSDPDMQRGIYRISPAGMVSGPVTKVMNPNGLALSPDEKKLYVGNVQNREITAFTLGADGAVDEAASALFATTMGYTLDGMAVDCAGNVYGATGTGVEVFSPAGMPIGTVPTGEASNATFGGADRKTLYVTSRSVLKAVTLAVPGLPD